MDNTSKSYIKLTEWRAVFMVPILLVCTLCTTAQQDPSFTHFMFNTISVNPAYAGSRDMLTATLLHRNQWVSLKGAPRTNTFTIHGPAMKGKLGLGLSFVNDNIGPVKSNSLSADAAYRMNISSSAKLVFGLKASAAMMSRNLNDLVITEKEDVAFAMNSGSDMLTNFGFGVYYHQDRFYVGVSVPKLLENEFKSPVDSESAQGESRHYYLIAGTVLDISRRVRLKPTGLVKMTEGAPIQMDLNATFTLDDRFRAGLMYRTGDAMGVMLGVFITKQLEFGYAFDWSASDQWNNVENTVQRTGHEIMLRYDLVREDLSSTLSPRFF